MEPTRKDFREDGLVTRTPVPTKYVRNLVLPVVLLVLAGLLCSQPARGAQRTGERLSVSAPDTVTVQTGDTKEFVVTLNLKPGWHINARNPRQDYLVPTQLTVDARPLAVRDVFYPPAQTYTFSFSDEKLDVYSDTVSLRVVLGAGREVEPGTLKRRFDLTYQACSDRLCLRPQSVAIPLDLRVVEAIDQASTS